MQESNGINRHVLFRYLMKELFLYFFIAFIFFFMVFFVNQILLVAENILKKHVPVMDVMRLITYSLPMVIAQSAPFATLVGFLMCL
ncbi:MAG: LptF/LptG family permease, partial [Treponema sp.]|nr:LptF/LptG family permease [Treponema sp.]